MFFNRRNRTKKPSPYETIMSLFAMSDNITEITIHTVNGSQIHYSREAM